MDKGRPTVAVLLILLSVLVALSAPQSGPRVREPLPQETGARLEPPPYLRKDYFTPPLHPKVVFTVTGASHTRYLRIGVYDTYHENGTWTREVGGPIQFDDCSKVYPTTVDNITVTFPEPTSGYLPVWLRSKALSVPAVYDPLNSLYRTDRKVEGFSFKAIHCNIPEEELKKARAPKGKEFSAYLQLPELPERIKELAENVTRGASSDYERARLIEAYLRSNYFYTLDPQWVPEDSDPLYYFLFVSKKGICTDFSTAFVILARLNGLPSRLVVGYLIDAKPGEQEVRQNRLHAWAEVYFRGIGWVTFDPTVGGGESAVSYVPRWIGERFDYAVAGGGGKGLAVNPQELVIHPGERAEVPVLNLIPNSTLSVISSDLPVRLLGNVLTVIGPPLPGRYWVRLKAENGSASAVLEVPVIVRERGRVSLSLPGSITSGLPFTLRGSVEEAGELEVYLNGTEVCRESVPENFSIKCRAGLPPGRYLLEVEYSSPYLYGKLEGWVTVKAGPKMTLDVPRVATPGPVKVKGSIQGPGSENLTEVRFYINGNYAGSSRVKNGTFEEVLTLEKPGRYSVRVESGPLSGSATVRVVSAEWDVRPRGGDILVVSGRVEGLQEGDEIEVRLSDGGGTRVKVQGRYFNAQLPVEFPAGGERRVKISLAVDGIELGEKRLVLAKGTLDLGKLPEGVEVVVPIGAGFNVFLREGNTVRIVSYDGAGDYIGESSVRIAPRGESTTWVLALALAIVASSLFALEALRRGKKTPPQGRRGIPIGRRVFLTGEEVKIRFTEPTALYLDGEPIGTSDSFTLRPSPGEHELSTESGDKVKIHVLPPREAVIKAYELCLLPFALRMGVRVKDATPEEILRGLERVTGRRETLKKITRMFEAAKYGRKEFSGEDFRTFLSLLEELGVECGGGEA